VNLNEHLCFLENCFHFDNCPLKYFHCFSNFWGRNAAHIMYITFSPMLTFIEEKDLSVIEVHSYMKVNLGLCEELSLLELNPLASKFFNTCSLRRQDLQSITNATDIQLCPKRKPQEVNNVNEHQCICKI
jgi:hypothetical protein